MTNLHPAIIEDLIKRALLEDISLNGYDITSSLAVPEQARARGLICARNPGVVAGLIPCLMAFTLTDSECDIIVNVNDGDFVSNGDIIGEIIGPARALLTAERTGLNILTHLSGIATMTAMFVDEVKDTKAKITCTRETLPGLRAFQKYAVKVGGGNNHRYGLSDAILIKDNHIAAAGGIIPALNACKIHGHMMKIEIEVDTLAQLQQVLNHGGADIVLLDNMDLKTLKEAIKMVDGKMITEASGGVSLDTVKSIAQTGVDYISVGALTHSAPALDIGFDFEKM